MATPPWQGSGGPVDAAADPLGPSLLVLVAEGVGEGAHRVGAGDGEAVVVQEGVEVGKGERAVATQQGEADAAEPPTTQSDRVGDLGRQRGLIVRGRAAAGHERDLRVEEVAVVLELGDEGPPIGGEAIELVIEATQAGEALVALDLDADTGGAVDASGGAQRDAPEIELAGAGDET